MENRHDGYQDLLESLELSHARYVADLQRLHGHVSQQKPTYGPTSSPEESDLTPSLDVSWTACYGLDALYSVDLTPVVHPQVEQPPSLVARHRFREMDLSQTPLIQATQGTCFSAECHQKGPVRDQVFYLDLGSTMPPLAQNLQQQVRTKQSRDLSTHERWLHLRQLQLGQTEYGFPTCSGMTSLVSDPAELGCFAKAGNSPKLYANLDELQPSWRQGIHIFATPDFAENGDSMLSPDGTATKARGLPTGLLTPESHDQLRLDYGSLVSLTIPENGQNDSSGPDSIEHPSLSYDRAAGLPLPLVSAMASVVASYASYCDMTANLASTLAVNTDKTGCFRKQLDLTNLDCEKTASWQSIPVALSLRS